MQPEYHMKMVFGHVIRARKLEDFQKACREATNFRLFWESERDKIRQELLQHPQPLDSHFKHIPQPEKLKTDDLKDLLKERGLKTSGKKLQLVGRLKDYQQRMGREDAGDLAEKPSSGIIPEQEVLSNSSGPPRRGKRQREREQDATQSSKRRIVNAMEV
jgi:hypothetical protein